MRVLQAASLSFDAAVMELCMAWGCGGCLVVPEPGPLVGVELSEVLSTVDAALLTPSVLSTLAAPPDGLPVLIAGAEALGAELVERFSTGRRMYNAYGPTEATIAVAVEGPLTPTGLTPPIGSPLGAARLVVLDDYLRPAPPGVPGELCRRPGIGRVLPRSARSHRQSLHRRPDGSGHPPVPYGRRRSLG